MFSRHLLKEQSELLCFGSFQCSGLCGSAFVYACVERACVQPADSAECRLSVAVETHSPLLFPFPWPCSAALVSAA